VEHPQLHRVVIIGGGFGGLRTAQNLKHTPAEVLLIDRRNFHLFQPLLYQVATGALSPANIAAPLRAILKRQRNTEVFLGEVTDVDVAARKVIAGEHHIPYDSLIVATGSRHHYFGHDEWEALAPGLKTVEDATEIRRRVLLAFENAELEADNPEKVREWLTFAIVGAGPTGVELAGAVSEIAHHTLKGNFRRINPADATILLIEGADRVLPPFVPELSESAANALKRLGVTLRLGTRVTAIRKGEIEVESGGKVERIHSHTILWAAGVMASPLGKIIGKATGIETDRAGRLPVEPDLSLKGHPEIFVIGDLALSKGPDGKPLPGIAPVAMQQGRYVARLITARLRSKTLAPFSYKNRGILATIGRSSAVADLVWIKFSGLLAWLAWLFVHIMYLVAFQNRILVMIQWAGNYFTRNRSARLITGVPVRSVAEAHENAEAATATHEQTR
jgi:NADH dehydrogenase